MSTRTFNPYPLIGTQIADGMDAIAADLTTESTVDDLAQAIYDYIQPIYYPTASTQIEIEVKSVVYNIVNAYNNKAIQYTLPYDEQQMKFIIMMLGKTTINTTPINAIDIWLSDIEDNISKSGLALEQQTPLLLAIESGKTIYDYWITKVSTPGEWSKFFQEPTNVNYIYIPYWLSACMNGALIGADASQKGLIAPTTDIVSVNIVSALIGALSIGAGKVIFKWVPEIQPVDLTLDNNGMLSGGFSEAIDINDVGSGANQLKKDNKCRTNSRACNNVQCINNCINTGTCTGVA
jgi:hypothetical protein